MKQFYANVFLDGSDLDLEAQFPDQEIAALRLATANRAGQSSYKQMADALGIGLGTFKSRLCRARKRLSLLRQDKLERAA